MKTKPKENTMKSKILSLCALACLLSLPCLAHDPGSSGSTVVTSPALPVSFDVSAPVSVAPLAVVKPDMLASAAPSVVLHDSGQPFSLPMAESLEYRTAVPAFYTQSDTSRLTMLANTAPMNFGESRETFTAVFRRMSFRLAPVGLRIFM